MSHLVSDCDPILKPEENKGYIIKAQGIIDVDFSKDSNAPSIGVESNTIDFGHSALRAKVDSRSLTQIITHLTHGACQQAMFFSSCIAT